MPNSLVMYFFSYLFSYFSLLNLYLFILNPHFYCSIFSILIWLLFCLYSDYCCFTCSLLLALWVFIVFYVLLRILFLILFSVVYVICILFFEIKFYVIYCLNWHYFRARLVNLIDFLSIKLNFLKKNLLLKSIIFYCFSLYFSSVFFLSNTIFIQFLVAFLIFIFIFTSRIIIFSHSCYYCYSLDGLYSERFFKYFNKFYSILNSIFALCFVVHRFISYFNKFYIFVVSLNLPFYFWLIFLFVLISLVIICVVYYDSIINFFKSCFSKLFSYFSKSSKKEKLIFSAGYGFGTTFTVSEDLDLSPSSEEINGPPSPIILRDSYFVNMGEQGLKPFTSTELAEVSRAMKRFVQEDVLSPEVFNCDFEIISLKRDVDGSPTFGVKSSRNLFCNECNKFNNIIYVQISNIWSQMPSIYPTRIPSPSDLDSTVEEDPSVVLSNINVAQEFLHPVPTAVSGFTSLENQNTSESSPSNSKSKKVLSSFKFWKK